MALMPQWSGTTVKTGQREGVGKWGRKGGRVGFISNLATARSTCGSCSHLLRASTLLVFRCGRLSIKIASAQRIPEAGHSCMAERKANIHFQKLWSRKFHELAFLARDVAKKLSSRVHSAIQSACESRAILVSLCTRIQRNSHANV